MREGNEDQLVFNTFARVIPEPDAQNPVAMKVIAAVRGKGLLINSFERQAAPDLFAQLQAIGADAADVELLPDHISALAGAGLFVRADELPSPVTFRCPLPERPAPGEEEMRVVPHTLETTRADAARPPQFGPGPIGWVTDERTGVRVPFWPEEHYQAVADLEEGRPVRASSAAVAEPLREVGALAEPGSTDRRAATARAHERLRDDFLKSAYVVIPRLLPSFARQGLATYYDELVREGFAQFGDRFVDRRFGKHNEPVARYFLEQLAPFVSLLAGRPVKPSYVFFARYEAGSMLRRHIDREQCEYSISFQVDYTPRPAGGQPVPWPLFVGPSDDADRDVPILLAPGDALLYRGRQLAHHRPSLAAGATSTHLFFHYVDQDFSGPLD